MASARHTSTERIAHSVCDRFQVNPPEDLTQALQDIFFTPVQAERILAAADRVRIYVGPGLDFTVSAKIHAEAQTAANQTRTTHFVGVTRDGDEIMGCGREALLTLGCDRIAWVLPRTGGAK